MSDAKHTAEPWQRFNNGRIVAANEETVAVVATLPGHDGRAEANARLMALAPELLAALREFIEYSGCRHSNPAERKSMSEKFEALGAKHVGLLLRAEGKD